ncbi:hypothetical protein H0H93_005003 [Arthromyces matolae]|nr:hypothetical protein H0H93_005003 [Arthromyces matolae]
MVMSTEPLPTNLYESLLSKLAIVLELTQKSDGIVTPQAKRALLQATNDFKNAINQAKELAASLPGGEMLVEEQDEVIAMLENLRDRKRCAMFFISSPLLVELLTQFSSQPLAAEGLSAQDAKMEIDSMASTPFHD